MNKLEEAIRRNLKKARIKDVNVEDVMAMLEWLPRKIKDAIRRGGKCNYWTDHYDTEWWPIECDSKGCECGGWYKMTYEMNEFDVRDGVLYAIWHECDSDGNWDYCTESAVGSEEYAITEKEFSADAFCKAWDRYEDWVIANDGLDPLANYYATKAVKVPVTVVLEKVEPDGIKVVKATRYGKPWNTKTIPPEVAQYCELMDFDDKAVDPKLPWGSIVPKEKCTWAQMCCHNKRQLAARRVRLKASYDKPVPESKQRREVLAIIKRNRKREAERKARIEAEKKEK